MSTPTRRTLALLLAGSALATSALIPAAGTAAAARRHTTTTPTATTTAGTWKSGASGTGAASGALGTWRGTPLAIGGTWNDSRDAQTAEWSIQPGAEWGSWGKDLDLAIGAIYEGSGETWAAAAAGAYDARWRTALTNITTAWGARTGTIHLRFAHEFNGSWTPWSVRGSDAVNFVAAWRRFRALQRQVLPNAKLVFCPNDGSSSSLSLDWRRAFPGAAYVDEMSVDSYNQYPFASTAAEFTSKSLMLDSYGAPIGIERHRQFAQSVGLPMAVSEWSSNSSMGDGAAFVDAFHAWVASHAGTGAGQVPYEVLFNVASYGGGVFQMYPTTAMPNAAARYVADF